jgi:hypothetical protein
VAVPFVDRFGVLRCDHRAKSLQRHAADLAVRHVEADDEFTLALVRKPGELTIASMLAIARFDAFRSHPVFCWTRLGCHLSASTSDDSHTAPPGSLHRAWPTGHAEENQRRLRPSPVEELRLTGGFARTAKRA